MSNEVDNLTGPQRAALGQLQAITNGADIPSEIAILSSVNWDVQRAADAIFDAQSTGSRPKMERMQLDDSAQNVPRPRRVPSGVVRLGLSLISIATFPLSVSFNIISHLVHFLFRMLRIPLPRLNFTSISFRRPRAPVPDDPASAADRFVRALEDETGAQVLSRARAALRERMDAPGPSRAAIAADEWLFGRGGRRVLPDFFLGSYEGALEVVRRDARLLCVVLLSSEHDDVPAFRQDVLTDPELVRTIAEHDILMWAGDVRERDAYQASLKLTATTYPFVVFISLQPRARSGSTGSNTPSLAILSRHFGPAATAAPALVEHITDTLIPRHQAFLGRLQAQAREREHDRVLRAEQDAAFAAAQAADAERIMRRRAEEAERLRAEETKAAAEETARRAQVARVSWRRQALARLDAGGVQPAGVRVGVRVPDGRRAVRWFREGDQVAELYAWVDGVLAEGRDADIAADEDGDAGPDVQVPEWPFRLAVAFPRSAVPCVVAQRIGDVASLRGGANLVVEGIVADGNDSEDDEG